MQSQNAKPNARLKLDSIGVPIAFLAVIIIWSTTPLAIKWSSGEAPFMSVFLRMLIGMFFCCAVLLLTSTKVPMNSKACKIYIIGGLSLFLSMLLFYSAAQEIPSGWIAVLFGISPLTTGLFSAMVEPDSKLTTRRICGLLLGLGGLYLVFSAGLDFNDASVLGVVLVLAATLIVSATSVISRQMVKGIELSGMQITTGSLIVAIPLFAVAVLLFEPSLSINFSQRSLAAMIYLGLIGTGIGLTLYYYLLKRTSANNVAMVSLITPITALSVGSWLNNEPLVPEVWLGAALVCFGLLLYEFKPKLGLRKL